MSVPTYEQIKENLMVPAVNDDKWGRPIKALIKPPVTIVLSDNLIKWRKTRGKWDG